MTQRKKHRNRFISLFLVTVMLCGTLCGCASSKANGVTDLMSDIKPREINAEPVALTGEDGVATADFALSLFQNSMSTDENCMISPISVLYALAMTANGAKEETLRQMEEVFGISVPELNAYLKAYAEALPSEEKYKLSIANSIWLTEDEGFTVNPDFLQTNADYYSADIYQLPFDDAALKAINRWVEQNTNGMIKEILNRISENAIMYLVNAVAFEAEWNEIYKENQIHDGIFTTEDGEEQDARMMYSVEDRYLEDDQAIGFIKPYADNAYAFVALLPKEGVRLEDYVQSLNGDHLASLLAEPEYTTVYASIPKFESTYDVEMSEILSDMGMTDAFNEKTADFTGIGESSKGNIWISRVIHKTFIAVDEKGTKAGAATVVEIAEATSIMREVKYVDLDRPFLYMIIDCEANLPLFIGIQVEME